MRAECLGNNLVPERRIVRALRPELVVGYAAGRFQGRRQVEPFDALRGELVGKALPEAASCGGAQGEVAPGRKDQEPRRGPRRLAVAGEGEEEVAQRTIDLARRIFEPGPAVALPGLQRRQDAPRRRRTVRGVAAARRERRGRTPDP